MSEDFSPSWKKVTTFKQIVPIQRSEGMPKNVVVIDYVKSQILENALCNIVNGCQGNDIVILTMIDGNRYVDLFCQIGGKFLEGKGRG